MAAATDPAQCRTWESAAIRARWSPRRFRGSTANTCRVFIFASGYLRSVLFLLASPLSGKAAIYAIKDSRALPDGDTPVSLMQRSARAQGRNVSGTRRRGSALIRKICGIRLKGCPAKTLHRRAGGSFTCAIRRFQQPSRHKEGAGCRNPAKLPSEKYLLSQPTIVSRGRRQCHDRFRQ